MLVYVTTIQIYFLHFPYPKARPSVLIFFANNVGCDPVEIKCGSFIVPTVTNGTNETNMIHIHPQKYNRHG